MSNRKQSVYYRVVTETSDGSMTLMGPLSGRVRKGRRRDVMIHTDATGAVTELSTATLVKLSRPTTEELATESTTDSE